MNHTHMDAYLLVTDTNHHKLSWRSKEFGHIALLEQDIKNPDRWLLRHWRNNREWTDVILESDFVDSRGEQIQLHIAIEKGMLDSDMNGETNADVKMIEIHIPRFRRRRFLGRFHRSNDVSYIKWRLGMGLRFCMIRSPYKLFNFFKDGGPDAIEKAGSTITVWSVLGFVWKLANKAG